MLKVLFKPQDSRGNIFFKQVSSVYPDVVNDVARRGHEIGWQAFQHEMWRKLSPKDEEETIRKSFVEVDKMGIRYDGFRPPGCLQQKHLNVLHNNFEGAFFGTN
jgi:hypothetical protein